MPIDFSLGPEAEAFAGEVRAWLAAHPPASYPVDGMDAGYGSGAHSREFLRALGAEGWISLTWPRAYGGAGERVEDPREVRAALSRGFEAVAGGRLALLDVVLKTI